jgi:uncharacterized protein (TIGR00661 family)
LQVQLPIMLEIPTEKNILVAPLNWGLGHATRCIPIIRALKAHGYTPILASDGAALEMLQKEFPKLKTLELPSYEIEYAKDGKNFKWKMLQNFPKMMEAIVNEKKIVKQWVKEHQLWGIISDNRLGVVSKKVPSIFITHQLNVLTGNTSWLTGKLHRMIIDKFAECWIPDVDDFINLSGKLGHLAETDLDLKYIGPLSRLEKRNLPIKYDLMVILSGPEPQRGMLEEQLRRDIMNYNGKIIFISGVMENEQKKSEIGRVTFYNYMTSEQLEKAFNESKIVLCRSGYTTVMDLAKLGKKAFFIPTPGQYEQEYLAKKYKKEGFLPYAKQENFRIENLLEIDLYKGLPEIKSDVHWKNLFCLFERE